MQPSTTIKPLAIAIGHQITDMDARAKKLMHRAEILKERADAEGKMGEIKSRMEAAKRPS